MRNLKFIVCLKLSMLLSILVITSVSCNKDDLDSSGYYGKWVTERVVPLNNGSYGAYTKVNQYLTISNTNKFNESFYIYYGSGFGIMNYVSIEGSLIVLDNQMQFNAEKISFSKYESQKVDPPYNVITNSEDIENTLNGFARVISGHNVEFILNSNVLTLSIDYNDNGDYLDYDETLTYTRQ